MSETQKNENCRYLSFSLGGKELAIPLLSVKEVVAMPSVTPIPHAPAYLIGIMNLRGQVLTIMDLRKKLNIKPNDGRETSVIICDLGGNSVGYVVDSVNSVFATSESDISTTPDIHNAAGESRFISGIFKKQDGLVLLLDLQNLFNTNDRAVAATATRKTA